MRALVNITAYLVVLVKYPFNAGLPLSSLSAQFFALWRSHGECRSRWLAVRL